MTKCQTGWSQASIVLPIQAVYLETSDSHFQVTKWSSENFDTKIHMRQRQNPSWS
jgi:hypothetical protein